MSASRDTVSRALVADVEGPAPNKVSNQSGVIYFFEGPDSTVYVGFSANFSTRRMAHENAGRKILAVMNGTKDHEARIHRHFKKMGDLVRPSQYRPGAVVDYLESLVSRGVAVVDPGDLPHVPSVTWESMSPEYEDVRPQTSLFPESPRKRISRAASVAYHASESDEWYTPAHVVEAARAALGCIDLDPASCPRANATVKATSYFSKRVNGLAQKWRGRVWMNPPYGEQAKDFIAHLFSEMDAGRVTAAVVLLNQNSMSSKWFGPVYQRVNCLLVTDGRLRFEPGSTGQAFTSPSAGSVICYFGHEPARFVLAFAKIGFPLVPFRPNGAA